MDDAARAAQLLADGASAYVLHRHADADAVAAGGALARALGGSLWAPAGVSGAGRRIAARLGVEVDEAPPGADPARFVLVDVSTWSQVGDAAERVRRAPHVLLDHHAYGDPFDEAVLRLRDPDRSSTCEVALDVLDAAGRFPAGDAAVALLAGIVADSGRFRWGNAATLRAALRLVEAGAVLEDAVGLLEEDDAEDERSRRLARLKAAQRARLLGVGDRIVAASVVGSHEAAAAGGLVALGADVALVATATPDGARVSGRAAADVPAHLGEALNTLAQAHPGAAGGGHARSAGLRADGAPEAWLDRAVEAVAAAIGGDRRGL